MSDHESLQASRGGGYRTVVQGTCLGPEVPWRFGYPPVVPGARPRFSLVSMPPTVSVARIVIGVESLTARLAASAYKCESRAAVHRAQPEWNFGGERMGRKRQQAMQVLHPNCWVKCMIPDSRCE